MALGKQIRRFRESKNWTLERLSAESGVEIGTISALELRDSSRSTYASKIAAAFGVSLETLMEADPDTVFRGRERANIKPMPSMRMVPVLNKVNAGMYKEIVESPPDDIEFVPVDLPTKRYTFALRVERLRHLHERRQRGHVQAACQRWRGLVSQAKKPTIPHQAARNRPHHWCGVRDQRPVKTRRPHLAGVSA